jgi:hypothetical protein
MEAVMARNDDDAAVETGDFPKEIPGMDLAALMGITLGLGAVYGAAGLILTANQGRGQSFLASVQHQQNMANVEMATTARCVNEILTGRVSPLFATCPLAIAARSGKVKKKGKKVRGHASSSASAVVEGFGPYWPPLAVW